MTIKVGSKLKSTSYPIFGEVVYGPYVGVLGEVSEEMVLVTLTSGDFEGHTVEWMTGEAMEAPRFQVGQVVTWYEDGVSVKAGPFPYRKTFKWVVATASEEHYFVPESELSEVI